MQRVRYGVVGLGFFGEKHAEAAACLPEIELRAVASQRPARLREMKRRFPGVAGYARYAELLADPEIDAVSIVTHVEEHVEPAVAALRAGKHVLLEKPMASSLAGCHRILAAARKADRTLMVGHICRFNPRYALAQERAARGELGQIVSLYARRNIPAARSLSVLEKISPLLGDGIHDTDLMLWLTGDRVEQVHAMTHSVRGLRYPDIGWAMLRFSSGAIGVLENVWLLPEGTPFRIHEQLEVIGTEGAIHVHGSDTSLTVQTRKGVDCPDTLYWPTMHGEVVGALRSEMAYFARCVAEGTPPAVAPPEAAREAVAVMLAAEESARLGKPVKVKK